MAVRVVVLRAPGTNCDEETAFAFASVGAEAAVVPVREVLDRPALLDDVQIVCVPGGFSYGDDLGAGRVLADQLRRPLGDALRSLRDRGGLILGICNGFQVLLRTGLLLDDDADLGGPPATLALNRGGRYSDRWCHVAVTPGRCAFFDKQEVLYLPVAHAEGNLRAAPGVLDRLNGEGRLTLRYSDAAGTVAPEAAASGSEGNVAGLCDATGRVFALMPHPERHLHPYHHPGWTRRKAQPDHGDGRAVFANAVARFA